MLVSNKISSGEKTINNLLVTFLYDDYEIKPLHIMLPEIVKLNGCIF